METMFNYYSLDECTNLDFVTNFLNGLKNDGKIIFSIDMSILKLEDIDWQDMMIAYRDDFHHFCDEKEIRGNIKKLECEKI